MHKFLFLLFTSNLTCLFLCKYYLHATVYVYTQATLRDTSLNMLFIFVVYILLYIFIHAVLYKYVNFCIYKHAIVINRIISCYYYYYYYYYKRWLLR